MNFSKYIFKVIDTVLFPLKFARWKAAGLRRLCSLAFLKVSSALGFLIRGKRKAPWTTTSTTTTTTSMATTPSWRRRASPLGFPKPKPENRLTGFLVRTGKPDIFRQIFEILAIFRQNPESFVKIHATYYPISKKLKNRLTGFVQN